MKHIFKILFLLFLPFIGFSQGGTWPVKYGDSDPSGAPSAAGTRLYFNTATNTLFTWEPAPSSTWRKQPKAFDQISGCAAPAYTPTARQSTFAVNSCTPPELYQYTGASWECLNCVEGLNLTAGDGITLSGTAPDITISAADASATNELNTSLSVSGSNLQIIDAGGTLTVPVLSIAPVQAVSAGTGISIAGTTTRTVTNTAPDQTVVLNAGTGISTSGAYPNFTVTNTAPNVVQTLSISGQDLTLSGGGGTVEIPAGADGNGIYSGSGTAFDGGISKMQEFHFITDDDPDYNEDGFQSELIFGGYYLQNGNFQNQPGYASFVSANPGFGYFGQFVFDGENAGIQIDAIEVGAKKHNVHVLQNGVYLRSYLTGGIGNGIVIDQTKIEVQDEKAVKTGITYAAEYTEILDNDRSIPDVGLTKQLISSENGALGTGFTAGGGAGTIPAGTTVNTQAEIFSIGDIDNILGAAAGPALLSFNTQGFTFGNSFARMRFNAEDGEVLFGSDDVSLFVSSAGMQVSDFRATPLGIEYFSDISTTIVTNPQSITDVASVNLLKQTPVSYTNAAAPNNCIFYSTTLSKLAYKDPGGTVNPLY